jgi:hypothetical protein
MEESMKRQIPMVLGLAVLVAIPLLAQPREQHGQHARPRANQGHIPAPPAARPHGAAEPERFEGGRMNSTPHVNHDRWYGHEAPGDARFRVAQPYAHGRFTRIGASFRYNVLRVDVGLHRFWLPGGFFFEVAPADWPLSADWCWNCGDDFVVYDDPDHPGWYLVYNTETGQYVHAQYMGQ